jgi:sialic acid synthase SpsE/mannose-6-phosphate isomerase-like protein (cupin superfamily)
LIVLEATLSRLRQIFNKGNSMEEFDYKGLFILDLANNHQGDLKHGINIIRELGQVVNDMGVRAAIKFQFRQLDTFIHPEYRDRTDVPHIPRFMSTRLKISDYQKLVDEVKKQGMLTMCTPFDEESVDIIDKLGIELIKIASCSVMDVPLLEKVANTNKPIVVSTGGATLNQIDQTVQLFDQYKLNYALHHCVAIYPTPRDHLQLNQIENLKNRYRGIEIGWSTHEDPNDTITVRMAFAKGATFFERHVGQNTDKYKLNKYSSTPNQIKKWIIAYKEAVESCGAVHRPPAPPQETESLLSLMRGVFAKKKIKKGQKLTQKDVFFAMPAVDECLTSGNWHNGLTADKDYKPNEKISGKIVEQDTSDQQIINKIMLQAKGLLHDARIYVGKASKITISHHYGLHRFREFGAVLIDIVNREYCKKLIIQLPRQKHPYHYHKKKEETFQILFGEMEVEKEGNPTRLYPGDLFLVEAGQWHKFSTLDGVVFEEISTTHFNNDSYYQDEMIARLKNESRKTEVPNWEI